MPLAKGNIAHFRREHHKAIFDEVVQNFSEFKNVSIIDKEFAHNNEESLVVLQEKGQQRYLFFYMGKLIEIDATGKIFTNPTQKQTEDYISGRFG